MIEAVFLYFLSPLAFALWAGLVASVLHWRGRSRWGLRVAFAAFAWLWVCSTPWVADTLLTALEGSYRQQRPQDMPAADAILVLGGAVVPASVPERPTLSLTSSSTRVWHAAALYRAGKAPWVIVAAGGRRSNAGDQIEADAIAELLQNLGVPAKAILLERSSETTRQNAGNTRELVSRLGARRVLLVTSGFHMRRAMKTFVTIWGSGAPELIPAVTEMHPSRKSGHPFWLWLPSLDALINVNKSLKEIAGLVHLEIIQ